MTPPKITVELDKEQSARLESLTEIPTREAQEVKDQLRRRPQSLDPACALMISSLGSPGSSPSEPLAVGTPGVPLSDACLPTDSLSPRRKSPRDTSRFDRDTVPGPRYCTIGVHHQLQIRGAWRQHPYAALSPKSVLAVPWRELEGNCFRPTRD